MYRKKYRKLFFVSILQIFVFLIASPAKANDREWLVRIDKQYNTGRYDEAFEDLKKYIAKYPEDNRAHNLQGWLYYKYDETDLADSSFDKAISLDPNFDNSYVGKGAIARTRNNIPEAKKWYDKALSITPNDPFALASLVVIELKLGNFEQAVKSGEKAWELNKRDATIPANLSVAYHYAGNIEKRDQLFQAAKELNYSNLDVLIDIFEGRKSIPRVKNE